MNQNLDYLKIRSNSSSGSCFHDVIITATVVQLRKILGEPDIEENDGQGKVNFDWARLTENGDTFTVYDWKEYRVIDENEAIEWHIGSHKAATALRAYEELRTALNEIVATKA